MPIVETPFSQIYTAYLEELKKNWAYKNTNKVPGEKSERFPNKKTPKQEKSEPK